MILFADFITYGTFIIAVLFIIGYARWSHGRWHETVMGWHLMSIAASEAVVFGLLATAHVFPQLAMHQWFIWLYLSCVASIGLVTLWRLVILWIVYHPRHGD